MDKGHLCIVVPCHNEEESLHALFARMEAVEAQLEAWLCEPPYYVLVDDGSTDDTLRIMRCLHEENERIRYFSFSRNFGKEAALAAGLRFALDAKTDFIAVMDADLQDPPELLVDMFAQLEAGFEVAAAYRTTRAGEPPIRSWFAKKFYECINALSDVEIKDGARDFRLMTWRYAKALLSLPEVNRFSKGIFAWVGYKTAWIPYENVERVAGNSSWNFWGLVRYALEGILAFSTKPLEFISLAGLSVCLLAAVALVAVFVRALVFGDPVSGWPSTICIILLLGGANLFGLGVVGLYLSRVYDEAKRRPLYFVEETSEDMRHSL